MSIIVSGAPIAHASLLGVNPETVFCQHSLHIEQLWTVLFIFIISLCTDSVFLKYIGFLS